MIKKIIACIIAVSTSLSMFTNSAFAIPHLNPLKTDFTKLIEGEGTAELLVPECPTCMNYIMRYEDVENILYFMDDLFKAANSKKIYSLNKLEEAKSAFEKIEKITGWSAHLVERVFQNTFDSLKESPNKTKIASELAQAAIGAGIAIPSAVSLFSSTATAGTTVATTTAAGTAATGAVATTAATGSTAAGTAAAGTAAAGGAHASTVAVTALKYAGMFGGTVLVVAGLSLAGYTAYSCYVDKKNHLEDIKINNYTSAIGRLILKLLDEDWKGNNVLIIAFDHGKDTPGASVRFYKVDGIDYGNKDFGIKFNRILNQLNAYFQSNNANNPALPSSQTIIDSLWNSAELQPKLNNI